ncbi:MAG: toprim domain-containing protein [Candidatus Pacebacteria bacterium]|nr:toprim domain-containing protein [Candidatus Paceibacterota bacterium]
MKSIDTLTHLISRLPGIGPRQARRIVFFLLREDDNFLSSFGDEIKGLKKNIKICKESFAYFYSEDSNESLHPIMQDASRENTLMVVEKDTDLESVEKSHLYHGRYFVLGGNLPVVSKDPEKAIRINELKSFIKKYKPTEIILALNANPEGDNTANYLQNELASFGVKISVLGRGFSTGTEIEYSDKETLNSALSNRG